jgi:hypothetical protein
MRKHLALIIEHDDPERVGLIASYDSRPSRLIKNKPSPIQIFDEDEGVFDTVGKKVGLGYADFEDEDDLQENFGDEVKRKLTEIDAKWVDKAGLDVEVPA